MGVYGVKLPDEIRITSEWDKKLGKLHCSGRFSSFRPQWLPSEDQAHGSEHCPEVY